MFKAIQMDITKNGWVYRVFYPDTNTGRAQRQADGKDWREKKKMPSRHWYMDSVGPATAETPSDPASSAASDS